MRRFGKIFYVLLVLGAGVCLAADAVDERAKRLDKLRDQYLDAKQKLIGAQSKFNDARTEYAGAIRTYKDDLLPRVLKPHQELLDSDARLEDISIVSAEYGAVGNMRDVSRQARALVSAGKPIPADCNALGIADPADKVVKSLHVILEIGGHDFSLSTRDGGEIMVGVSAAK